MKLIYRLGRDLLFLRALCQVSEPSESTLQQKSLPDHQGHIHSEDYTDTAPESQVCLPVLSADIGKQLPEPTTTCSPSEL